MTHMTDDSEALRFAEFEMVAEAARAADTARLAVERMREADQAIDALEQPTWGGVVDQWHEAKQKLDDALQAAEAYKKFPPQT
jgi:hypothetical protein